MWHLKNIVTNGTKAEAEAAKAKFKAKNYPYYDEYLMFYSVYETNDSNGKVDVQSYMRRGTEFLAKYGKNNDSYTIALTSLLGNYTGRKDAGLAGIQWMEDLLARNRNPRYLSTCFYILWRNYHLDEAIAIGNEMRANAIKTEESTKEIDSQIAMVEGLKVRMAAKSQAGKLN